MRLNLKSAQLARVRAAYRIVFGHPVPCTAYQMHEPGELAVRPDKAIRDMRPLDEFNPHELVYPNRNSRPEPLPLSGCALVRWQYMRQHRLAAPGR